MHQQRTIAQTAYGDATEHYPHQQRTLQVGNKAADEPPDAFTTEQGTHGQFGRSSIDEPRHQE
jgi:hypothetical protein